MNSNVKVTIAVAFVLTFLIGIGAGFLFRGGMQPSPSDQEISRYEAWQESRRTGEWEERTDRGERNDRYREHRDEIDREYRDRPGRGEPGGPGWEERSEREWDGQRRDYGRLKNRLQRELDLSDERAEAFFEVLETHREKVKQQITEHRRAMREHYLELKEELDHRLSEILTEEQMELWEEKYAPRMERMRRDINDNDRKDRDSDRMDRSDK